AELGGGDLGGHRLEVRARVRGHGPLGEAEVGGAEGGERAPVPGLLAHPGDRRQPVVVLVTERVELAAGAEAAPAALHQHLEAVPGEAAPVQQPEHAAPAVRGADEHDRGPLGADGDVAVGEQGDAVGHPYGDVAVDTYASHY